MSPNTPYTHGAVVISVYDGDTVKTPLGGGEASSA